MTTPHKLGVSLGVGARVDDHQLATLQLLEPVNAPPQEFDLISDACLYHGIECRVIRFRLHIGREFAIRPVREPCRNLAGVVLEELMDPAAAQAGRGGDLSNGQPRVMGRNDGPQALALGLCETRGGQAEPCVQGLFAPDAWPQWLTSLRTPEKSGVSLDCPGNWTGYGLFLLRS
jgi:hypothetical protein